MKERPILFSGPMVRAILDGRKTQTRRVVKAPKGSAPEYAGCDFGCPYGVAGDRLWVRETWAHCRMGGGVIYRATNLAAELDEDPRTKPKWRPSIFMSRSASRITLEIVDVRVERVQEIGEADARAEGVELTDAMYELRDPERPHREAFEDLWDEINGRRAPWRANPWVWVVEFRRVGL